MSSTIEKELKQVNELVRHPIESLDHINEMKKKAAIYLDQLCKDLETLDSLSGDTVRPLRKREVRWSFFIFFIEVLDYSCSRIDGQY